jgi:hypothetical protein
MQTITILVQAVLMLAGLALVPVLAAGLGETVAGLRSDFAAMRTARASRKLRAATARMVAATDARLRGGVSQTVCVLCPKPLRACRASVASMALVAVGLGPGWVAESAHYVAHPVERIRLRFLFVRGGRVRVNFEADQHQVLVPLYMRDFQIELATSLRPEELAAEVAAKLLPQVLVAGLDEEGGRRLAGVRWAGQA